MAFNTRRSLLAFAPLSIFLVTITALPVSAQLESTQLDLFCTNNRDGTGACFDESTNQSVPYDCVAVPGSVVPCKSPEGLLYQCQWVGMQQAQLACQLKPSGEQISDPAAGLGSEKQFNSSPIQPAVGSSVASPLPAAPRDGEDGVNSAEFANTFVPAGAPVAEPSDGSTLREDPFLQNFFDLE